MTDYKRISQEMKGEKGKDKNLVIVTFHFSSAPFLDYTILTPYCSNTNVSNRLTESSVMRRTDG